MKKQQYSGQAIQDLINAQFTARDSDYESKVKSQGEKLTQLEDQLLSLQKQGCAMQAADQYYIEAKWLWQYSDDWARMDAELEKLAASLKEPKDQAWAEEQSPTDGAWGQAYNVWFEKVDDSVEALNVLSDSYDKTQEVPKYPLTFLDKVGTPDTMTAYMDSVLVSNIPDTGYNNREPYAAISADLSQLCFKHLRKFISQHCKGFDPNDAYVQAYADWLDGAQDPETGYWGNHFVDGETMAISSDLSITYHIVAYRKGKINHWSQLIDHTFEIAKQPYPYGWLHNGHLNNHNDYDLVRMLKLGWDHMSDPQKAKASAAFNEMIDYCLTETMTPSGGFKADPTFYNSVGAAYYFGVAFLDEVGYFGTTAPFWRGEPFPEGQTLCCKIKQNMKDNHISGNYATEALAKLDAACQCEGDKPEN